MGRCGNHQNFISAHIDKLKPIKRISDICKINELRNRYDKAERTFRNFHSSGIATDN